MRPFVTQRVRRLARHAGRRQGKTPRGGNPDRTAVDIAIRDVLVVALLDLKVPTSQPSRRSRAVGATTRATTNETDGRESKAPCSSGDGDRDHPLTRYDFDERGEERSTAVPAAAAVAAGVSMAAGSWPGKAPSSPPGVWACSLRPWDLLAAPLPARALGARRSDGCADRRIRPRSRAILPDLFASLRGPFDPRHRPSPTPGPRPAVGSRRVARRKERRIGDSVLAHSTVPSKKKKIHKLGGTDHVRISCRRRQAPQATGRSARPPRLHPRRDRRGACPVQSPTPAARSARRP